jgi:hypothetical protein
MSFINKNSPQLLEHLRFVGAHFKSAANFEALASALRPFSGLDYLCCQMRELMLQLIQYCSAHRSVDMTDRGNYDAELICLIAPAL